MLDRLRKEIVATNAAAREQTPRTTAKAVGTRQAGDQVGKGDRQDSFREELLATRAGGPAGKSLSQMTIREGLVSTSFGGSGVVYAELGHSSPSPGLKGVGETHGGGPEPPPRSVGGHGGNTGGGDTPIPVRDRPVPSTRPRAPDGNQGVAAVPKAGAADPAAIQFSNKTLQLLQSNAHSTDPFSQNLGLASDVIAWALEGSPMEKVKPLPNMSLAATQASRAPPSTPRASVAAQGGSKVSSLGRRAEA